jgi:uncharacterized protein
MADMPPGPVLPTDGTAGADRPPVVQSGLLRVVLFLGTYIVWMTVFGVVAGLVIMLTGGRLEAVEHVMTSGLGGVIEAGGMVGVLVLILLFRKLIDRRSFVSLGFSWDRMSARDLIAGMALGAGIITTVFIVLLAAGGLSVESVEFPIDSIVVYAGLLSLVALEEEAMCRGYILLNVMQSMNKYLALLIVSILFSLLHLLNPNPSVVGYFNIVLAGLLLGIYYVHKRNLWFPIGLHLTWNFFQGIVFGSPVSGVYTPSILSLSRSGNELLTGGEFGFEASLVTTGAVLVAIVLIHFAYRQRSSGSAGNTPMGGQLMQGEVQPPTEP